MSGAGDGFRQTFTRVTLREHRLALQVRRFDEVPIRYAQTADTGSGQRFSLRRTERSASHDQDARFDQTALPFSPNTIEKNLPAITIVSRFQIQIIQRLVQSSADSSEFNL